MPEAKVKGFLFHYATDYVEKKWGNAGLERIGMKKDRYIFEKWYPMDEFLDLLTAIEGEWGKVDPPYPYKIAYSTMTHDVRWPSVFRGKDPRDLFLETKYQNTEYVCGDFEAWRDGEFNVVTRARLWIRDHEKARLFAQFYYGQVMAVLKMTGKKGDIVMDLKEEDGDLVVQYNTFIDE